jgi:hypothetical protein
MINDVDWNGRPIDEMSRTELVQALKSAVLLLRSIKPDALTHPEIEVTYTPSGMLVGRTFNWAFIPAGQLWSDEDRRSVQARLDVVAARYGFQGAVVRFALDRLEVHVPRRLQVEQILALQEWLASEKDSLDISQVP